MVRIKHRYLLVNILYPDAPSTSSGLDLPNVPDLVQFRRPTIDTVTGQVLLQAIRRQLASLFGDYGSGITGGNLIVKYFSNATSTFILRCPREHFRLVWAAVSFTTQIPIAHGSSKTQGCVLRVVRTSGTIKKVEEEAIRQARADILRAMGQQPDDLSPAGNILEDMFGLDQATLLPDAATDGDDTGENDDQDNEMEDSD